MMLTAILVLAANPTTPASTQIACEMAAGTALICTELRLGKDEDPKLFTSTCSGGHVKSHCEREAAIGKCTMGDTTLFYLSTPKTSAGEAAGFVKGGQSACSSHGGTFESKVKITPIKLTQKPLSLGELSIVASSDCTTSDSFGTKHISCGNSLRPEVTLDVSSYTGDEVEPQNPDDVLKLLAESTVTSTVKELSRKTGKAWRLEYSLTPKHGLPAFGFEGVKQVGGKQFLCVGSAWSKADFEAAKAMCESLKLSR